MRWLDAVPRSAVTIVTLLMLAVVGLLDFVTGVEIHFFMFYLFPIALAGWRLGRSWAFAVALSAAGILLAADLGGGHDYSHPAVAVWNISIRLVTFAGVGLLVARLRTVAEHESKLARTDALTQALNRRAFYEELEEAVQESRRSGDPLSLAYVDLDLFKQVNDRQGHDAGDAILRVVAEAMRDTMRAVDRVARLGGDEFAILIRQAAAPEARAALDRLLDRLIEAMRAGGWPVTFSAGLVSCHAPPPGGLDLLQRADRLMFEVKRDGRAGVRHEIIERS